MPTDINKAFERFQKEDLDKHKGKWIAVSAELGVVSAKEDLQKAIEEFKKRLPDQEPLVFKVPAKLGLIVYGGIFLHKNK